jgi:predicted nucleotidyltransferase
MADPKTEKLLARITTEARAAFGGDLVSVVVYGSAAGDDFIAGRSDVNVAIVLDAISFPHLQALAAYLPAWRKQGAAAPLFVDHAFLARARDVFPMEILDIRAEHRLLFGEDVFTGLDVDFGHLRFQLEQEARAKLLRLQVLYAECGGGTKALRELMLDSARTFVVLMRSLLRFRGGEAPTAGLKVLDRFEEDMLLPLPALREVLLVAATAAAWERNVGEIFADYLSDVEKLVDVIDRAVHEGER